VVAVSVGPGVIGRRAELRRIDGALESALAGEPRAVLVTGDAGLGKTTLLAEASRRAHDLGFGVALGGCSEIGGGQPFAPVQAVFRSLADQHAGLEALVGDRYPAAASLLPGTLEVTSDADTGQVFASALAVLAAVASPRPLLLALEDLHWADRSTVELLSYVLRNVQHERLVVVATTRRDELDGRDTGRVLAELSRLQVVDRIDLRGFGRADLTSLLVRVTGRALAPAVVDDLLARTGGNPFLATELAQAEAFRAGELPETVREIMALRLAPLAEEAAELLAIAAAMGTEIDVPLLADVTGHETEHLEGLLRAGVDAGVLVSEPVSATIRFRHALIQEAVHARLLPTQRQRIHLAVADCLVGGDRPAPLAVIAEHYERAGTHPDKALDGWLRAARQAAAGVGRVDAVPAYERAVALWSSVPGADDLTGTELVSLLKEAAAVALSVGETDSGARFAEEALRRLDPDEAPQAWADLAIQLSELRWEQGDMADAVRLLVEAEERLVPGEQPASWSRLLDRRSFHALVSGDLGTAEALARESVARAEAAGDLDLQVDASNPLALSLAAAGRVEEAVTLLDEVHALARTHRLTRGVIRTTINQLVVLMGAGRIGDAIDRGERGLEAVAELTDIQPYHATTYAMLARARFLAGDWRRVEEILDEAPPVTSPVYRSYLAVARADLAAGRGDLGTARRVLAETALEAAAHPYWLVQRRTTEAALALVDGRPLEALAHVDEVLDLSEAWSDTTSLRLCSLAVDALVATGRIEEAERHLARGEQRAATLAAAPGEPAVDLGPWLAHLRAQALDARGEPSAAAWAEASAGFEACGLLLRAVTTRLHQAAATDDDDERRRLAEAVRTVADELDAAPLRAAADAVVTGLAAGPDDGPAPPAEGGRIVHHFAGFEVDPERFELRCDGELVPVEPQVFDVLLHLLVNRDRVVTKEELLDAVWGDRFVSESALTSRIKAARRAVGDDGRRQGVIGTVHGRGYRFVAPVESGPPAGSAPAPTPTSVAPAATPAAPTTLVTVPPPGEAPRTHYARSGGYSVAYQVFGDGPEDLVFIPGLVSNLEVHWEHPEAARFFRRLGEHFRVIVFDKRGTGLSERVPVDLLPTLEERIDDVRTVMDAVGSTRTNLFGTCEGSATSLLFAAVHPERVSRLALFGAYGWNPRSDDVNATWVDQARDHWGTGTVLGFLAPSAAGDRSARRFLSRLERHSATPDVAAGIVARSTQVDLRDVVDSVAVPTTIVHRRDNEVVRAEHARQLAAAIPTAEYVELEGSDHLAYLGSDDLIDEVVRFITGTPADPAPERILTTVLFVDIVASTEAAARLGDAHWHRLLQQFHDAVARAVETHRGTVVKTLGDGALAHFDGPARAVRAARAATEAARDLGLDLRAGVHTAEVEVLRGDLAGMGVHIGARVASAAAPGEVWATRTVRDLVVGSGLDFDDRGVHQLKGVTEPWPLYAAS